MRGGERWCTGLGGGEPIRFGSEKYVMAIYLKRKKSHTQKLLSISNQPTKHALRRKMKKSMSELEIMRLEFSKKKVREIQDGWNRSVDEIIVYYLNFIKISIFTFFLLLKFFFFPIYAQFSSQFSLSLSFTFSLSLSLSLLLSFSLSFSLSLSHIFLKHSLIEINTILSSVKVMKDMIDIRNEMKKERNERRRKRERIKMRI